MRYLVTGTGIAPFLTDWFDIENNYNKEYDMVVYDLKYMEYYDGNVERKWVPITEDHL